MAVTTISRFRLALWILALLCSHGILAEPAVRLENNRPASTRGRNPSSAFDVRLHSVSRRTDDDFGTRISHFTRHLLQGDTDSSNTEYLCSLQEEMTEYLDAATRTWRIDGAALSAIDNDVQAIVNCTTEGDTLLFDVGVVIRPRARITIPWKLTISAATSRTRRVNGLYPKAPRKATITCPTEGEGVFLVRSKSVLFANLRFENCSLRGLSGSEAIVQVEECQFNRTQDAVQLHHVSFERNTLIDVTALSVKGPSCARLELVDFEFSDSDCGGRCGVTLSSQNRLRNIRIHQIRFFDSANRSSTVFYGSDGSETSIKRMNATESECSLLHVEGGTLNVSDSTFLENDMYSTRENDVRFCIRLSNSTGSIQDSHFRRYKVRTGSAVTATASNLTVIGCVFGNNVADEAGAIRLAASSASIRSCNFSSNEAILSAGVLMASESRITVSDSIFEANKAAGNGGCFYLKSASNISLIRSSASQNAARNGSVAFLEKQSSGRVVRSFFGNNSATSNGGSFFATDSRLSIRRCRFENGTAESGGAISIESRSSGLFVDTTFRNNSANFSGGALHLKTANASLIRCHFAEGYADRGAEHGCRHGGFVYAHLSSDVTVSESVMEDGEATEDGGCLFARNSTLSIDKLTMIRCNASENGGGLMVQNISSADLKNIEIRSSRAKHGAGIYAEDSYVIGREWIVTDNDAFRAGGMYALRSGVVVKDSVMQNNTAEFGGVFYLPENSTGTFVNVTFRRNSAKQDGGTCHVEDSELVVRKCHITEGSAENGGAIFALSSRISIRETIASNLTAAKHGGVISGNASEIRMTDCSVLNNVAAVSGGVMECHPDCTFTDTESNYSRNSAEYGGAINLDENCSGSIDGSKFDNNNASKSGGTIYLGASTFSISQCNFSESNATWGGFIYATETRMNISNSNFKQGSADYGGCTRVTESKVNLQDVEIASCRAQSNGGAVQLLSNSAGTLKNVFFVANFAQLSGGSIIVQESNASLDHCTFQEGHAENGGLLTIAESGRMNMRHSVLRNSTAKWGGCVRCEGGSIDIQNVTMEECLAELSGGAIRMAFSSKATVQNSVFVRNHANNGGGIALVQSSSLFGDGLLFENNTVHEGGGALASEQASTIEINSSVFQNNAGSDGGVLIQHTNTTGIFTNVTFVRNQAWRKGGIAYATESNISFDRCVFERNIAAEHGGFLYSQRSVRCHFNGSVLIHGFSREGGCIVVEKGNLTLQKTSIHNCIASKDGGALHLSEGANATVTDSSIDASHAGEHGGGVYMSRSSLSANRLLLTGNIAKGDGGGIFSEHSTGIRIFNDSYFGNNSAQSGGGVALRNTTGSLIGVRIYGNLASNRGGACCAESSSNLRVVECTIRHSEAGSGGSFFVRKSHLKLISSKLKAGRASAEGGFISATENSSISADTTSMIAGKSKEGGAVFLSKSIFTATGIRISQCKADGDGGAIKGIDSSRMLCSGCTLNNNNATHGGAMFAMYNDTRMISMQLDNCTLQNNSATFGGILDQTRSRVKFTFFHAGGVQVMAGSESVFRDCRAGWDKCKAATMVNTVFADNEAKAAGGAVFIDTVAGLRLSCSDESAGQGLEFYSEKRWKSMKRLTSLDDVCPSWKNNSAGRYGPDVASYASDVLKKVTNKKTKWLSPSGKNHYTIRRHKSGRPILIAFTPVDDLEQSPAVGMDNNNIEAVTFSPNGFFVGSVRVPLNAAGVNISTTGFVQPDEYTVQIDFEGADLESLEITVEVQKCEIGEVPSANGTFCEPCSDATFSFFPEEDLECHPCPENGRCNTSTIQPLPGYWHPWPCSSHLQKCLTEQACDFDQREKQLYELTKDMESCHMSDDLVVEYGDAQCGTGHTGPLCGSCKPGYGKAQFFTCKECFSHEANVLLYLLSILVFLILAAIAMKTNLEPGDQYSGSKVVVEVFKIAVDYAQVTAIAISINVSWSTTLSKFFEITELVSGVVTEAIERTVHCLLPEDAAMERAIFGVVMDVITVVAVMLVCLAFWGTVSVVSRRNGGYFWKRAGMSFFVVSYLGYISLTSTSIHVLTCLEVHDSLAVMNNSTTSYWAADTNIQCHEGSHAVLERTLGWPLLVVFSFGFPVVVLCITVFADEQERNQGDRREVIGFIYQSYKKRYCYWETVVLLRKAALAVVVMLAYPLGPNLQVMFSASVFTVALYLQTVCRPFGEEKDGQNGQQDASDELDRLNDLESTSLLVSLLTFVSSLCFDAENVSSGVRSSVSLVILALNLVFFSYLVIVFAGKCVDRWIADPNAQPLTSGSSSDEP